MKQFIMSLSLFSTLFFFYGFVILPYFMEAPELKLFSLFSFLFEYVFELILGYLLCIPISLFFTSLVFRDIGNLWAILTYVAIIFLLYIFSSDVILQILVVALPLCTILHYHSHDLRRFLQKYGRPKPDVHD